VKEATTPEHTFKIVAISEFLPWVPCTFNWKNSNYSRFRAQLCKLQKRVHSTRSRKWWSLPVACPGSVVLSGFFHH